MATQSGSGDSSMACSEQNSLADTRGNGYVADKLRMIMMMTLCVSAVFAVGRCLSVCLSVRHVPVLYADG